MNNLAFVFNEPEHFVDKRLLSGSLGTSNKLAQRGFCFLGEDEGTLRRLELGGLGKAKISISRFLHHTNSWFHLKHPELLDETIKDLFPHTL